MYRLTIRTGKQEVTHHLYETHQTAYAHLRRLVKDNRLASMPGKSFVGGRGDNAMRVFVRKMEE